MHEMRRWTARAILAGAVRAVFAGAVAQTAADVERVRALPLAAVHLQSLDEQLTAVPQSVISELHPNAETSAGLPQLARRLPTDAPLFKALYQLSIKHRAPLALHLQWHPESVAQLARLLESDRNGTVVLSHCGKDAQAEQIRAFLDQHPNVYCDLNCRSPPQAAAEGVKDPVRIIYWGDGLFRKAGIKPEWLKLIEDHPARFMVGVDDVQRWGVYDDVVAGIRSGVLAFLKPETAEKVAYRNAVRVFGLVDDARTAIAR